MECNRDEATRAKTIAEEKMEKKDYAGAKKFTLKAQNLYPGLEGLSQMLTTLDVYISAENKISGEVDWYGVLGVNPSADDETVRKQYRKLALVLHPDKNKSVGADGAFKLLSEAWSLLSDKVKRLAYNQRRSLKGYQGKVQTHTGGSSAPPRSNGFHNFTTRTVPVKKPQANSARVPPKTVPTPPRQRTDTFWTICQRCKMYYEYLKIYLNHVLLCPNCHEAFLASETAPPFNHSKSSNVAGRGKNSGPVSAGQSSFTYANHQRDLPPRTAGVSSMDPSIAAKAANVVQQAQEKMKRERDESHDAAAGGPSHIFNSFLKGEAPVKKSRVGEDGYHFGSNMAYQTAMGNNGFGMTFASGSTRNGFEGSRLYGFPGTYSKTDSIRELTPVELRYMLMDKARNEILNKLKDCRSKTATKTADTKKERVKESKQDKERRTAKGHNVNGSDKVTDTKRSDQAQKCNVGSSDDVKKEDRATASMNVPDSDFHDFDLDRTGNSFGDNEVWAAYDDVDGMPRFYALIHKVISRDPFKVKFSWLNSKTNSEFAPLDWVGSGFYKTCGEFRVGKHEVNKSINSFSHKVNWSKGLRGTIHIFPRRGDVWAVYRNWSPEWNRNTPDEVVHKYDMVLVLDDYNEQQGVSVAPLVKVAGFKTIFHPHVDPEKVTRVPKEEMFRFSHQVPHYLLTGEEAENAPKGCQELDPAATPVELLQVTTEEKEVRIMKNDEDAKDMESQNLTQGRVDDIKEGFRIAKEDEMIGNG